MYIDESNDLGKLEESLYGSWCGNFAKAIAGRMSQDKEYGGYIRYNIIVDKPDKLKAALISSNFLKRNETTYFINILNPKNDKNIAICTVEFEKQLIHYKVLRSNNGAKNETSCEHKNPEPMKKCVGIQNN